MGIPNMSVVVINQAPVAPQPQMAVVNTTTTVSASDNNEDAVNEADLIILEGCCCYYQALYCKMPECIGCSEKSECCCCVTQWCCKIGTKPLMCNAPEGNWCQLGCVCCSYGCKPPETCCMGQAQLCCIVEACAFPTTDEVPCIIADCGLVCYPKVGCCQTVGSLTSKQVNTKQVVIMQPQAAPPPPQVVVVQQR